MLLPMEKWQWNYCSDTDRLLLDIGNDLQFRAPFSGKQLYTRPQAQRFSIQEASAYTACQEALELTAFNHVIKLEITLTAVAAGYLQLQAHKSWYFAELVNNVSSSAVTLYDIVQLQGNDQLIMALVVQQDADCVSCLLLEHSQTVAGKQLQRCTVVRVLRNRVSRLQYQAPFACSA